MYFSLLVYHLPKIYLYYLPSRWWKVMLRSWRGWRLPWSTSYRSYCAHTIVCLLHQHYTTPVWSCCNGCRCEIFFQVRLSKYRIVGAQASELVVTKQISFLLMLWDSDGVFTFNILIELYHVYRVKLSLSSDHSSLNCIGCIINKHFWIKVLFSTCFLTGKLLITKYECLHHLAH